MRKMFFLRYITHRTLTLGLFGVGTLLLFSSCRALYPSRMLQTGSDYAFSPLPDHSIQAEYRIAPNDVLSIIVSTNDGERMLESAVSSGGGGVQASGNEYLVAFDGTINLPMIRKLTVTGLTLQELEKQLEEKFTFFFKAPYVRVKVTNHRVIIFPGGMGGTAQVIGLDNPNTTLFEALAKAGGIADGKAYKIKLIRGESGTRKVYLIDLSHIEGLQQADMVLMANDIIYVEPMSKVPQTLLGQITPYLTLGTTLLVIYSLFK